MQFLKKLNILYHKLLISAAIFYEIFNPFSEQKSKYLKNRKSPQAKPECFLNLKMLSFT